MSERGDRDRARGGSFPGDAGPLARQTLLSTTRCSKESVRLALAKEMVPTFSRRRRGRPPPPSTIQRVPCRALPLTNTIDRPSAVQARSLTPYPDATERDSFAPMSCTDTPVDVGAVPTRRMKATDRPSGEKLGA